MRVCVYLRKLCEWTNSACVQSSFPGAALGCICDCSDLFLFGLFFLQESEEIHHKLRKTLRINRDAKGIVVKMLITMLTAMYVVVKVVESVR